MKDIVKEVIEFLKSLGLADAYLTFLFGIPVVFSVLALLWKIAKQIILIRNQRLLNADLNPYFTGQDVVRATKYFIPTRYQNVSPSEDEEPGRHYIASAQGNLLRLFLKTVFRADSGSHKYFLILADSGMGKTTFLINLFLRYKNQWSKLIGITPDFNIELFPLGNPDTLAKVSEIQEKKNTILLLDAFDEDVKSLDDHRGRMTEILNVVHDFHQIVITCRTQFFPSEEEEPYKTGYFSFGESGEFLFQKLYLSVFDDADIRKYLRKRFFFSPLNYLKARAVVEKCASLVVRPMLLSRIDDLLDSELSLEYPYQIYEAMIGKWIERESLKRGIQEKYGGSENYREILYTFSKNLAIDLYKNKDLRGGYYLPKDEKPDFISEIKIGDLEMSIREARGQSLLNRNGKGEYKFSHKSILEYFLARELIWNRDFEVDFEGMSAARRFRFEMVVQQLSRLTGSFVSDNVEIPSRSGSLRELAVMADLRDEFFTDAGWVVTELKLKRIGMFNLRNLTAFAQLKTLWITDETRLNVLYEVYKYFQESMGATPQLFPGRFRPQGLREFLERHELLVLAEHLGPGSRASFSDVTFDDLAAKRDVALDRNGRILTSIGWDYVIRSDVDLLHRKFDKDEIDTVRGFLEDMEFVKEHLPNCLIFY